MLGTTRLEQWSVERGRGRERARERDRAFAVYDTQVSFRSQMLFSIRKKMLTNLVLCLAGGQNYLR